MGTPALESYRDGLLIGYIYLLPSGSLANRMLANDVVELDQKRRLCGLILKGTKAAQADRRQPGEPSGFGQVRVAAVGMTESGSFERAGSQ